MSIEQLNQLLERFQSLKEDNASIVYVHSRDEESVSIP